jgi:hypothetical protein
VNRAPRERDPAYLGWVAKLPCVACMYSGKFNTAVQVAHVRAGSPEHGKRPTGMAEKPSDKWVAPLCMPHHTGDHRVVRVAQHQGGEIEFWERMGINIFALCLDLNAAYAAGKPGAPIITLAAARGRRTLEDAPR